MTTKKRQSYAEEIAPSKPKFVQIQVGSWTSDEGREGFSVIALTDTGEVMQYMKGLGAWVPFNDRVLREV